MADDQNNKTNTTWRTYLSSYVLNPVTTFVDANLQLVRTATTTSFLVVSILVIRKLKGVRRYTSALDVPPQVYGDVLRVRCTDTSFHVEHRPMFGMLLRNLMLLSGDASPDSTIPMRPYGVVPFNAAELHESAMQDGDSMEETSLAAWLTSNLIAPRTILRVVPLELEHPDELQPTKIVAHMHASIYHGDGVLAKYLKQDRNISMVLVELGLVQTAVENSGLDDVAWMQALIQAENHAKEQKMGFWAKTKWAIEEQSKEEEKEKEKLLQKKRSWWRRWFGNR